MRRDKFIKGAAWLLMVTMVSTSSFASPFAYAEVVKEYPMGEEDIEIGEEDIEIGEEDIEIGEEDIEIGEEDIEIGEEDIKTNEEENVEIGEKDKAEADEKEQKVKIGKNVSDRLDSPENIELDIDNKYFSWSPVEGADSYKIRIMDEENDDEIIIEDETTDTYYQYTGELVRGYAYWFEVAAVKDGVVGNYDGWDDIYKYFECYQAVTNPRWDDERPGVAVWDDLPEEKQSEVKGVCLKIYKDGEVCETRNVWNEPLSQPWNDMKNVFGRNGEGEYSFCAVWKFEEMNAPDADSDFWSEESDIYVFRENASGPLDPPENIELDIDNKYFSWSPVEGADSYKIRIMDEENDDEIIIEDETTDTYYQYTGELQRGYCYIFEVAAVKDGVVGNYDGWDDIYKYSECYQAVTNPRWDDERPGVAVWDDLPEEKRSEAKGVCLKIYKDGEVCETRNVWNEPLSQPWHDMKNVFGRNGEGEYSFCAVWKFEEMNAPAAESDFWSEESGTYIYRNQKTKTAVIPSKYGWKKDGTIEWTAVSKALMPDYKGEVSYNFVLYEDGKSMGDFSTTETSYQGHIRNMKVGHTYTFQIRTNGDLEGGIYKMSELSKMSDEFTMKASEETAKGKLDSLMNAESVETAAEEIKITSEEKEAMKDVLQSDAKSAQQYRNLEENYRNATSQTFIVESKDNLIDTNKVSVAGAVLNGASKISFEFAQNDDASLNLYTKKTSMDISLDSNDEKFPVLITMPVPSGMKAERVKIYHYHEDGTKEEITPRVITENGTKMLQFAVSDFSVFTFVEKGSSGGSSSGGSSGGSHSGGSSSGGGSSSSTSGPATGITSNDVPENAPVLTGNWVKNETGWWFEKSEKDYPKNQWANINGAIYRFNDAGYMIEGWFALNNKWYYLMPTSGAMSIGWIMDANKWYYLNTNGVMAIGWIQVDEKWYYLGNDGAMLSNTITPDQYRVDENGVWIQ